jgi:hypothetical protein
MFVGNFCPPGSVTPDPIRIRIRIRMRIHNTAPILSPYTCFLSSFRVKITTLSSLHPYRRASTHTPTTSHAKLQEKTFSPQKRTPSTSKMKFINFFLCMWIIFALLDPDTDPGTQLTPAPILNPILVLCPVFALK